MTISYTPNTGLSGLSGYAISITDATGVPYPDSTGSYPAQTRTFPVDTSFEPYRREAFRHRSIPAQRNAIQMTNIMGEGTVNTEGLWRREMREFQDGAGQQYLDHKEGDVASRFYSSKGVDVFSFPSQAKLLPDTYATRASSATNLKVVSCNGYMVTIEGTTVIAWYGNLALNGVAWNGNTISGLSGVTSIYDITSSNTYIYIATNNGIWYAQPQSGGFTKFASGSYTMVAWANDQLIASNGPNLYAFQPRNALVSGQANAGPIIGAAPSNSINSLQISSYYSYGTINGLTGIQVHTRSPHTYLYGQSIAIAGTTAQFSGSVSFAAGATSNNGTVTVNTGAPHGMQPGSKFSILFLGSRPSGNVTDSGTVATVPSTTSFTYNTSNAVAIAEFTATGGPYIANAITSATSGNTIDGTYAVLATHAEDSSLATNAFVIGLASSALPPTGLNGTASSNISSDLLYTHPDPYWVWSDAVGGETQIYFAGYSSNNGSNRNGCIYRSDLLGASTTSATNTQTVSTSQVAQPWQLVSPVQALPMSPDEYPTCIQSYLNFIFIGTNRGIRMAQTLSIYDPTATATGDLKSGPIIPNILQPITNPVTAIVGDGRFVWFAWSNYDSNSTGLGRLDLTTFISGDPLAPVYASDLMVTGQGIINSLAWNPVKNVPTMAVAGRGVYEPYATNVNGIMTATKYVSSGSITSSIFDYGIPDQKAPVYFEYGGSTSYNSNLTASVVCEPLEIYKQTLTTVANSGGTWGPVSFTSPSTIGTATKEYQLGASPTYVPNNPKSSQFQVTVNLNAGTKTSTYDTSPILYRWTLKSFPNVVSGTNISVVLQLFSVAIVDGEEVYMDPYDNFYWLESLRQAQNLITYTEGPLSASIAIVESLDWIPHKRRDNYENGFEGDCVITIKTLGPYSYTPTTTY